ncbi:MAG: exo-alpha-sialidase, partial [Bacteroidales bacterium]|nr:exo-alpha-sialidase [Bacteroidales bacterium]
TQLYQKGIVGHCAYNRAVGAQLVLNPEAEGKEVLKVARIDSDELEIATQGAVWNFPALYKGRFETAIYIPEGSQAGRLSLSDRWFNPSDTTAYQFAMYNFDLTGLKQNKWNDLVFEWDFTSDNNQSCSVKDNEGNEIATLPLNFSTVNGISYVHFISTAEKEDTKGFLIERVESMAK